MSDLSGKHGLIVGVANKRSISWAIAQAAAAAGARLALTYPSERLEENVRELAAKLENPLVLPCDVTSDQQIADWRRLWIGNSAASISWCTAPASRRPTPDNPFVETSREGFRIALDVSAYSLVGLTRAVAPLMERRGGGSILTLTFIGSERVFRTTTSWAWRRRRSSPRSAIWPAISGRRTFASTRFPPARSRRSRPRVSPGSRASCRCIAIVRRCDGTSSVGGRRRRDVPAEPGLARGHRRNPHGRRRDARDRSVSA